MKFCTTAFVLPKEGYTETECEDTFSYDATERFRFALADGAASASYSHLWATLLVTQYVTSGGENLAQEIRPLRQRWRAAIDWDGLPYYMWEKARRGDYCTLLGLSFHPGNRPGAGHWRAMAVGDSCLFHVRQGALIGRFPVDRSSDFNDHPPLIGSIPRAGLPEIKTMSGDYSIDDLFLLATDAGAEWFLDSYERGEKPWEDVERLKAPEDFTKFVSSLRKAKRIKDDDVTFVTISLKNLELLVVDQTETKALAIVA